MLDVVLYKKAFDLIARQSFDHFCKNCKGSTMCKEKDKPRCFENFKDSWLEEARIEIVEETAEILGWNEDFDIKDEEAGE